MPREVDTSSASQLEADFYYSNQPDVVRVGEISKVVVHLAGAGNDLIYVDATAAGTIIRGENGADMFLVCGIGGLSLNLELGPLDTAADIVVIDAAAFRTAPSGGPTITITGFVSTNDRLFLRTPPDASVTYLDGQVSVDGVTIQVLGSSSWGPFVDGAEDFNPESILVSSAQQDAWSHPPANFRRQVKWRKPGRSVVSDGTRPVTLGGNEPVSRARKPKRSNIRRLRWKSVSKIRWAAGPCFLAPARTPSF